MAKTIDFDKTIFDLCSNDSDIPLILEAIGFKDITKPGMITTVGRFMTIKKGAAAKKIDLNDIKQEFIRRGYEIIE